MVKSVVEGENEENVKSALSLLSLLSLWPEDDCDSI
jgi:hypothetical protein